MEKQYLWGGVWEDLGDDDLFDDLLVYLDKHFLEAAGNFHTLNN